MTRFDPDRRCRHGWLFRSGTLPVALTATILAGCGSTEPPRVIHFCGHQAQGAPASVVDVILDLDHAASRNGGALRVRVDALEAPGGYRLADPDPTRSVVAALTVDAGGPARGCASSLADTVFFNVAGAPLPDGWLRVKTPRPARLTIRTPAEDLARSEPLPPGASGVVSWAPGEGP